MRCNGCRVLGIRRCPDSCVLRSCLQWIPSPIAQGHAASFLSGFYGQDELLSRLAAVPEPQRPAMFHSLLLETCGRAVNPVSGLAGLQASGNWHLCMAAFNGVMVGRAPRPLHAIVPAPPHNRPPPVVRMIHNLADYPVPAGPPPDLEVSGITQEEIGGGGGDAEGESEITSRGKGEPKLLNLFE